MTLRDKDIQFFLDLEILSESEASFCSSDGEGDSEDKVIVGPLNHNEIQNFINFNKNR